MSILKNRRMLLTGGADFPGSDFAEKLLFRGVSRKPEGQVKQCPEVRKEQPESGFIADTSLRGCFTGMIQAYKKASNPDVS